MPCALCRTGDSLVMVTLGPSQVRGDLKPRSNLVNDAVEGMLRVNKNPEISWGVLGEFGA